MAKRGICIEERLAIVERIDPAAPFKASASAEQYRQNLSIGAGSYQVPVSAGEVEFLQVLETGVCGLPDFHQ